MGYSLWSSWFPSKYVAQITQVQKCGTGLTQLHQFNDAVQSQYGASPDQRSQSPSTSTTSAVFKSYYK